jgi:hypothetical protein
LTINGKKERTFLQPRREDGWYRPIPKVRMTLSYEDVMGQAGWSGMPEANNGLEYKDSMKPDAKTPGRKKKQ